ncbi:hypothetical protein [Frankia sp. Cr1]|uniref:hypothetical protein n=1 Tax=Frankia sp. Cr1 TaxID=3073931 RepID=UPI002AD5371F|nr:hypothetical protein [Frankia sp. Cr1]
MAGRVRLVARWAINLIIERDGSAGQGLRMTFGPRQVCETSTALSTVGAAAVVESEDDDRMMVFIDFVADTVFGAVVGGVLASER